MEGITMPLFEGQEHYQRLMKLAMDTSWSGILIADREGQYLFANRRYEELTGWSNEVVQELDSQVLGQYLIREKVSTVDLVLQQKKEVLLVQSSSCDERIFLVRGVPYFDQSGAVAYVICHLLELSALQHYTDSLESSRRKSQHVFEDFVKIADQNGAYSEKIIFRSQAMYQVMEQINLVAQTDATVLIRGESGVGKELFAKRLHDASSRRGQPFIRLNCSAIPDALLESELFGYEAGAFTGWSAKGKKGLLEHANRGLLFEYAGGVMQNYITPPFCWTLRSGNRRHSCARRDSFGLSFFQFAEIIFVKKWKKFLYYPLEVLLMPELLIDGQKAGEALTKSSLPWGALALFLLWGLPHILWHGIPDGLVSACRAFPYSVPFYASCKHAGTSYLRAC